MGSRTLLFLSTLIVVASAGTVVSQSSDQLARATESVSRGEVVVELKPGASIDDVNERNRTSTKEKLYGTNFYRLQIPAHKKEKKWRRRLEKDADVLTAALNPLVSNPSLFGRSTASFPDGVAVPGLTWQDFQSQTDLFNLLQLADVKLRSRGAGTVVAVIDTGVAVEHPAIAGHLWVNPNEVRDGIDNDGDGLIDDTSGWNFYDNNGVINETPDDPETTVAGHGTFIAALIATMASESRIMCLKTFPPDGVTDSFTVAAAVKYAADHGANVISLSLGSSEVSGLLEAAILDARSRGIAVVAAVGNDGNDNHPQFPSTMDEVLAVAAIDLTGHRTYFSNYGSHVDVCAPGWRLVSAFPWRAETQYARWSGTSFAAPFAAAEAALVLSADPRHTDVKSVIERTAVDLDDVNPGYENKLGHGRIDPLAALKFVGAGEARPVVDRRYNIDLAKAAPVVESYGKAGVLVSGTRQEFTVEAYKVNPRVSYNLVVDGVAIASNVPATSLGAIRFSFTTDGNQPLPPPINPVTKARHIEVRAGATAILFGDFTSDTAPLAGYIERETQLISTITTGTSGSATIKVEALDGGLRRETLKITVEGLQLEVTYRFLIDGFPLGSFQPAAPSGFLKVVLTSDGSSGALLPGQFRPVTNIHRIELQDSRGSIVAAGMFAATSSQTATGSSR